ncbi:MAG: histidine kinase dimerization/phosphoacceptor domain -containing protein [Saprospiraceae bacterium]
MVVVSRLLCLFLLVLGCAAGFGQNGERNAGRVSNPAGVWHGANPTDIREMEQSLPSVRQSGDEAALGRLLKSIGDAYAARNYFRQSIDHYREAMPLLRKTEQARLLADCLQKMAGIQAQFGYSEAAINHFSRALKVNAALGDSAAVADCHTRLARLYFSEKNYEEALAHNREVLRMANGNQAAEADAIIQEAIILTFLERLDDTKRSLQKARELVDRQHNPSANILLLSATSNFYLAQQDHNRAKVYLDSAKALIQGSQNPELAIAALDQMALLHQKNGDYRAAFEAMVHLNRYKDIFRTENIERISAEINDAATTALREKEIEYLNLNNALKAAELRQEQLAKAALLRQYLYQDSALTNQALLLAALETEARLRSEQLNREKSFNAVLNRENALKQENLDQERRLQRLLWLGLGLFALLGGVIFYQFRKQRRNNAIIRRQSDELIVLNKEVHHRVKNNLQVISSMLDLQSLTMHHQRAKVAIKEAILRVQAMAFIHQNLYLDEASNTVDMHDYIAMLSSHLFGAYNIRPDSIRLDLRVEPIRLHTDTAVPLGMILNELISNALKYAFKGRSTGTISVVLERKGPQLWLRVADDGIGLPPNFDPERNTSFGYEMIYAFAQKLKASLLLDGTKGTDVQLFISKFKTSETP